MLFAYFSHQSSEQLASKIEHNFYSEKELVEVKVHLNLPYYNSQTEYESFEGEITLNGNHYNYVKRKVSQDTLYLMCLPNIEKDGLQTAKNNYGKAANDFDGEEKNKGSIKKENGFSLYQYHHNDYSLTPPQASVNMQSIYVSLLIPDSFISQPYLPPELNS